MKLFPRTINRNDDSYREMHYRARWQPLWAILGLVLCVSLVVTQGWTGIYDLCAASPGVSKEDSIVDIVAAYLGVSYSYSSHAICKKDPRERKSADRSESQQCFLESTSRISWCTRRRSNRMSRSGIDGTPTMYQTSPTYETKAGRVEAESEAF